MNEDLRILLTNNLVHQDIVSWLQHPNQECLSLKDFANWLDKKDDAEAKIVSHTSQKDVRVQVSRVKQAWREAEGLVTRALKRASEGLSDEFLDDPLDSELQKSKIAAFSSYYHWHLLSKEQVSDSLLGRLVREFERRQPSMFAVLRVRSLAATSRSQAPKKHRISDQIQLEYDAGAEAELQTGKIRTYFSCLRLLCNGWAIAGCFDVTFQGKVVKYAHWQELCRYVSKLEDKAWSVMDKHPEDEVLRFVSDSEELIRAKAVELARSDAQVPFSMALLQAWNEECEVWADARDALKASTYRGSSRKETGGAVASDSGTALLPQSPQLAAPSVAQAAGGTKQRFATGNSLSNGQSLCKRYNDSRTCTQKICPRGEVHGCDVMLLAGAVCGKKDHNRAGHIEARHGAAMMFQKKP